MDTPAELAPGYAMALIQIVDRGEAAGDELVLTTRAAAVQAGSAEKVAEGGKAAPAGVGPKAPFKPAATWTPLEDVVGKLKTVPLDHSWIESARKVGTSLGD